MHNKIWPKTLMELIFNPLVNFGGVQRVQLAKSTLLTSTLVPWELFRSFKMECGKQREATASIHP